MSNKFQKSLTFRNATAGKRAAASYRKQFDLGLDGQPRKRGKKNPIKSGDYFLMPYAGRKRELLVRALIERQPGYWDAVDAGGVTNSMVCLASCKRISPSEARRILGKSNTD